MTEEELDSLLPEKKKKYMRLIEAEWPDPFKPQPEVDGWEFYRLTCMNCFKKFSEGMMLNDFLAFIDKLPQFEEFVCPKCQKTIKEGRALYEAEFNLPSGITLIENGKEKREEEKRLEKELLDSVEERQAKIQELEARIVDSVEKSKEKPPGIQRNQFRFECPSCLEFLFEVEMSEILLGAFSECIKDIECYICHKTIKEGREKFGVAQNASNQNRREAYLIEEGKLSISPEQEKENLKKFKQIMLAFKETVDNELKTIAEKESKSL